MNIQLFTSPNMKKEVTYAVVRNYNNWVMENRSQSLYSCYWVQWQTTEESQITTSKMFLLIQTGKHISLIFIARKLPQELQWTSWVSWGIWWNPSSLLAGKNKPFSISFVGMISVNVEDFCIFNQIVEGNSEEHNATWTII